MSEHDFETAGVIRVHPWADPVIDTLGHDPRSQYVETFWLPTLGPTALLTLRLITRRFEEAGFLADARPDAVVELPVADTSQALGLGPRDSKNSPFRRSLTRLIQFDLALAQRDGSLAVRRTVPPVNRRHVRRLPSHLQVLHERWLRDGDSPRESAERRSRRIAFVLAELGTGVDEAERVLAGMGFPPMIARRSAVWGQTSHRQVTSTLAHPSSQPADPDAAAPPSDAAA